MKGLHITLYQTDTTIEIHIRNTDTQYITTLNIQLHNNTRRVAAKYRSSTYIHTKSFWKYWLLEHNNTSLKKAVQTMRKKFKFKVKLIVQTTNHPRRKVYCGNNRRYHGLLNDTHIIGTRYKCLRRGFGIGMYVINDNEPDTGYEPIDDRRVYCGNNEQLPDDYDMFGSLSQCLQKGVGVGKRNRRN